MSINVQQSIEVHAFREASFIIDESGVAETVRTWLDQDGQHPELSDVDLHNVLAGWVGAAFAGLPLTEANVVRVLRTSPSSTRHLKTTCATSPSRCSGPWTPSRFPRATSR